MNKHYCVLPFYSVETVFNNPNKNIFCCRLPPGTDIESVRATIKQQERSPNCNACWALEDAGFKSERQIHNETMDFLLDLSIENIEVTSIAKGFDPVNIKLATSNLCNGQCVTCNSTLSSSWAQLEGKSTKYTSVEFDKLDTNINWAKIVSLSFVGGEPLLEKKNFHILERLISLGNTNCFVSIVTNGSITLTKNQFDILQQFKNLNICLSIDGTGSVFEYMRYPLKWDILTSNLQLFRELTTNISVSYMVSNLNIGYYAETIDFFKANNLNYLAKQVLDPYLFNPSNLLEAKKAEVRKNNSAYIKEVDSFLNMYSYNAELYNQFLEEIAKQDQLKNININDYMYRW
jgi:sulfatase maturation enzyme AslB (radical SAM superfamily)